MRTRGYRRRRPRRAPSESRWEGQNVSRQTAAPSTATRETENPQMTLEAPQEFLRETYESGEINLPPDASPSQAIPFILSLQNSIGNKQVQRQLYNERNAANSASPTRLADREEAASIMGGVASGAETATLPKELQDFRKHGPYPADKGGTLVAPKTGMGGFNARYDPASMTLNITVNIGFNFINSVYMLGSFVFALDPRMSELAKSLNEQLSWLDGEDLENNKNWIREEYQWKDSDPKITKWMTDYKKQMEEAWSSNNTGIVFQSSTPGWDSQLVRVQVVVNTNDVTALKETDAIPGPQPKHCKATIFKTPDSANDFGANVHPGKKTSATDQALELGSGQLSTPKKLLTGQVGFDHNSASLTNPEKDHLNRLIIDLQAPPGGAGTQIELTGHANTVGDDTEAGRKHNQKLSEKRASSVASYLKTAVVEGKNLANAETRMTAVAGVGTKDASEADADRRVDIKIASGEGQKTAVHEFGHMIGLGDEYSVAYERDAAGNIVYDTDGNPKYRGWYSGTGGAVGAKTDHSAEAEKLGLGASVYENNTNVMALGNSIQPIHYTTFISALQDITGNITSWKPKT